jgi:hypothetical protein
MTVLPIPFGTLASGLNFLFDPLKSEPGQKGHQYNETAG